jgi:hypothetical protein
VSLLIGSSRRVQGVHNGCTRAALPVPAWASLEHPVCTPCTRRADSPGKAQNDGDARGSRLAQLSAKLYVTQRERHLRTRMDFRVSPAFASVSGGTLRAHHAFTGDGCCPLQRASHTGARKGGITGRDPGMSRSVVEQRHFRVPHANPTKDPDRPAVVPQSKYDIRRMDFCGKASQTILRPVVAGTIQEMEQSL